MTYCDVTVKATTQNLDTDDIEALVLLIGKDNVIITNCDDYELPKFVLSANIEDILQYLQNVDDLGNSYEVYCDYHSTIIDKSSYEDNYRGSYLDKRSIANDYLETLDLDLPNIISSNLDYDGIIQDLDYLVIQGSIDFHVFYS